jgi:hypothetical protein
LHSTVSQELRRELSRISDGPLADHTSAIRQLTARHPHSIAFVEAGSLDLPGCNCFMYALDLRQLPDELVQIVRRVQQAHPGLDWFNGFVVDLL